MSGLRSKKAVFKIAGKTIKGCVAHVGTIKEVFTECCYMPLSSTLQGDIIDIGANIGLTFMFFKKRMPESRIVCVEPDENNAARFRENFPDSELIFAAIAEKNEIRAFTCSKTGITSALTGNGQHTVRTLTVDQLVKQKGLKPGLIKIDVEGIELEVLRGASNTLKGFTPQLLIEVHKPNSSKEILAFLRLYGYNNALFRGNNVWAFS